jgi:clan AA aspartic protease (TIGR02281 family)
MTRPRQAAVLLGLFLATAGAALADLDAAGREAYARGDYAAAERSFRDAITGAPADPLLRYHRAGALTHLGRWDEAIDEYERVMQLRPNPELAAASRKALKNLQPLSRRVPVRRGNDGDESTIRLERAGGGWLAEVILNDAQAARFLVDTGASVTVLSPEMAEALGIAAPPRGRVIKLHTLSGEVHAPVVNVPSLRLGELEATDVVAVIHPMVDGLDGILGNTFLARYTVTLDARRGLLTVRRR